MTLDKHISYVRRRNFITILRPRRVMTAGNVAYMQTPVEFGRLLARQEKIKSNILPQLHGV